MIVPVSTSGPSGTPMGEAPSETNLLMALATMHSYGKFGKTADTPSMKLPKVKTTSVGGEA